MIYLFEKHRISLLYTDKTVAGKMPMQFGLPFEPGEVDPAFANECREIFMLMPLEVEGELRAFRGG